MLGKILTFDPTRGYGFHPLRIWGKNFVSEFGGHLALASPGGPFIQTLYFQKPKHQDASEGKFYYPDHYDSSGRPWKNQAETIELGGVYMTNEEPPPNPDPLLTVPYSRSVKIFRNATQGSGNNWTLGDDLVFQDVTNGILKLADLVRSNNTKLKIARGQTGGLQFVSPEKFKNFGSQPFNLPSGFFSAPPNVFLTPNNSGQAYQVSLTADAITTTGFNLLGGQALAPDHVNYPIQFTAQWLAVGT